MVRKEMVVLVVGENRQVMRAVTTICQRSKGGMGKKMN